MPEVDECERVENRQSAMLAQHVREVGKRFCKVAAGFTLNGEGNAEEIEFRNAQAIGGRLQRFLHCAADLGPFDDALEFFADRTGNFLCDNRQRFGDGETRAQAANQQFDGIGELLVEVVGPLFKAVGPQPV